jgi:hypothetical protein
MQSAARVVLLSLVAVSLPAVAATDKETIREAIHSAVATKTSEPASRPAQDADSKAQDIAEQVVTNGTPSSDRRNRIFHAEDCASLLNCPFGSMGALTFDEVRYLYRNYSDSELWNICLGRRAAPYPGGGQDACMILGSPNPLRPVDVPHNLERDENAGEQSPPDSPDEAALIDAKLQTNGLAPCKANETLARKRPVEDCARQISPPQ